MARARTSRVVATVMAVALLLGLVPEAARAAGPVQNLSATIQHSLWTDVGIADSGASVAIWARYDGSNFRAQVRRRTAGGTLGPILTLSATGRSATSPRIAVAPDGTAVAAWTIQDDGFLRVQTRRISAKGALGPIRTVTPAGSSDLMSDVAIRANGDVALGLTRLAPETRARVQTVRADDSVPAGQNLGAAGSYYPSLGFDAAGNLIAAWHQHDGTHYRVQTRRRTTTGSLTPVQSVSVAGKTADILSAPEIDVASDGTAVIAWSLVDGSTFRAQARKRTLAGSLSPISTLSVAGKNARNVAVAVDDDGDAVVAWQLDSAGSLRRIQARRRLSAGSLSPIQTLSAASVDGRAPSIDVDAQGDVAIGWFAGDNDSADDGVVQVRVWRTTGMGSTQTLSAHGEHLESPTIYSPKPVPVAVSPDGSAVATWARYDGTWYRAQLSPFST